MEYIPKPPESRPEKLDDYQDEVKKWHDYYAKKRKSKPHGHWTDPEIRKTLARLFLHCCGYCGLLLDVRPDDGSDPEKDKTRFSGQVDHYHPKAKHPSLVYDWNNYIWSCSDCNGGKNEEEDPNCLILSPCVKNDVAQAKLDENSGCYIPTNNELKDRLDITEQCTWINQSLRTTRRKMAAREIRNKYKKLVLSYQLIELGLANAETYERDKEELAGWIGRTDFRPMMRRILREAPECRIAPFDFQTLMPMDLQTQADVSPRSDKG